MALINETKEEGQSSHNDLDQLDALWATFRLPVPIASKGKYDNHGGPPTDHDEWLLKVLELLRLLHTMNQQYAKPKDNNYGRASRIMNSQMALAYSMLAKVERTFPSPQQPMVQENNAEDAVNPVLHQNCHILLQKLRNDTEGTCAKSQRWLDSRSSARQQQNMPQERDLIYDIFFAPDPALINNEKKDESNEFDEDEEDDGYEDDNVASNKANTQTPTPNQSQRQQSQPTRKPPPAQQQQEVAIDPVEFQKQQQELLEEELASMATRLKSSTLAMNSTLQTQTKELDDMEVLAQTNLDQVTDTAKKVGDRLVKKKGWKKRLATWSLIGTVVGMFVLCFMVMRTLPKRKVGRIHLFRNISNGRKSFWDTWRGYFSQNKKPSMWEEDEEETTGESGRQWQDQKEQRQKQAQENWERQQQEKQRRQQEQQECEVLSDGSQICFDPNDEAGRMEAKARALAAERKQRRIEENMANAPVVDAVDSREEEKADSVKVEQDSGHNAGSHEKAGSGDDQNNLHVNNDPMGCILTTINMLLEQSALDSLSKALAHLESTMIQSPEGSTQRLQVSKQKEKLQSQMTKHSSVYEMERNKARGEWWANRANRIKARDARRALGSIPFCDKRENIGEFFENKEEIPQDVDARRLEEERREKFQERIEQERLDQEVEAEMKRTEQERMEAEEKERRQRDEARLEAKRLEQERLGEAAKQAELAELEQERIIQGRRKKEEEDARRVAVEQAEADRLEEESLANEAESERLENERIERERVLTEQAEAEREQRQKEKEEEARRLEAEVERLEQEKLANQAEVERREQELIEQERMVEDEKARQLLDAKATAEAGAKEAMDLATQIAADNLDFLPSDVRSAAGRLKNDLLAHYISASPEMVDASDRGGWRPIHEAARAGNLFGIQLLISAGCDLTSRTGRTGKGGTALWWAIQRYGEDHSVVQLLRSHGALEAGPVA